jgi:hypothetical protein
MEDAMFVATILSVAGIGFLLWLLFTFAVYALPFYAGLSSAFVAYEHGSGLIGALLVGLVVAGLTFGLGQVLFATLRAPSLRALVALVYAAPAGVAGYHAVHGLSAIGDMAEPWRVAFSVVGAAIVAGVAWIKVSALYPGDPGAGIVARPRSATALGAANDG